MTISQTEFQQLKYSKLLKSLIDNNGVSLPEDLDYPKEEVCYRYAFKNEPLRNHLPVYVMSPKRAIKKEDSNITTSGYALSCLTTEVKAIAFFNFLKKTHKHIKKTTGDILTGGILEFEDGLVTLPCKYGHFDLYEYRTCNLNAKFVGGIDL